jgi:hypothetical protein
VKFSIRARPLLNGIALASAIRPSVNGRCIVHLSSTGAVVSIRCTDKAVGTAATSVSAMIREPAASPGRPAALVSGFAVDAFVEIEATAGTVNVVSGMSSATGQMNRPYSTSLKAHCDEHLTARPGAC